MNNDIPDTPTREKIRRAYREGGIPRVAKMALVRAWHPIQVRWDHSWLERRHLVITIQRRLSGKPVVHAIGDSHTHVLRGVSPFVVTWLGAATAYNLGNPASSTGSNQKMEAALKRVDKRRDMVLLALGEVDTRIHVYGQYMKRERADSMESIIDVTVETFGATIEGLRSRGYRVTVQSVPATPHQGNIYEVEHYADDDTRAWIVREYNARLKAWCVEHEVGYLDLYSVVSDDKGFLRRDLTDDGTHLNARALPVYCSWVDTLTTRSVN